ncbi:MAG: cold shock domain-containing protein [Anaerolineae bacterium]|nr:cold shock domain-containing protein [Anaerolineae bacterium]
MHEQTGIVKWFSNHRGYGFIEREEGEDLFVHHTAIQMEGYRTLEKGQYVRFNVHHGERGPEAANVVPAAS